MKQMNYKKLIIPNIPYVFFVYLFDKVGHAGGVGPGLLHQLEIKIQLGFQQ